MFNFANIAKNVGAFNREQASSTFPDDFGNLINTAVKAKPDVTVILETPQPVLPAQTIKLTTDAIKPSASDKVFDHAYNSIQNYIEFDPRWAGSTGYFEPIITHKEAKVEVYFPELCPDRPTNYHLAPGEQVRSLDPSNRRLIITATRLGIVVIFERFTPGHGPKVYVRNTDRKLERSRILGSDSAMSEDQLISALGDQMGNKNVGFAVEQIYQDAIANTNAALLRRDAAQVNHA